MAGSWSVLGAVVFAGLATMTSALLSRREGMHQARVRSFAAGVGLAFVMLDLIVELAAGAEHDLHDILRFGPEPIHTLAAVLLAGAAAFIAAGVYAERQAEDWRTYTVALAPQVVYSGLTGAAMVHEAADGWRGLVVFVLATSLHVAVTERGLARHFPKEHSAWARVLLFGAPLGGALVWATLHPRSEVFYLLLALIAGTTLLGVLRDEIPAPREVHLGAFVTGVFTFGALVELRWWV